MNHPLAAFVLVVLSGICLIAYLFGFSAGRTQGRRSGHEEGHEEGKKEGRKEESIRAFAVGYDRGKREGRDKAEGEKASSTPGLLSLLFVVILTIIALTVLSQFMGQG